MKERTRDDGAPHTGGAPTIEPLAGEWIRVSVGDRRFEVAAACPHRGGRLLHGHVNARTLRITCPLHRSSFDLPTGCQVWGPSTDPLTVRSAQDPAACHDGTQGGGELR